MTINMDQTKEARFALYGRILRCPLGGNPDYCPLHEIRKLPLNDRIVWLEARSNTEVIELYRAHTECLQCRLDAVEEEER